MNSIKEKFPKPTWALPCFYCGVDSGPAVTFFVWMIGAGVLAFACFYRWGYLNGKFSSSEQSATIPIEAEGET